ncbi:hypothetical protein GQ55_3G229700 [Panicum hallii var. hallii]|uniref:WRKY domain-containing protein n=1 Tax=Panicum hallii var. hallii TaxID=1504633 RepID=A0A2T7ECH4_9POAL|nr:hypothetical protein GQ55_3G229700 [Panicum hallii var. hallii]
MATADRASAACGVMAEAREAGVRLLALLQATGADTGKLELAEQIICCIDRARAAVRAAGEGKTGQGLGLGARPPAGSKRRSARRCGEARARVVASSAMDDGYAWRKYGEKSIQDRKNPRFYFRCAYRDELGCGARKQVDRMEDDPSLFHTTYFGEHTPACPRDAAVADLDRDGRRFVVQASIDSFRACLPAEGEEMPASMVEFTAGYCWPLKDQMANLVSSDVSFATPGELESLDAISMEELLDLLWP